MAFYGRQYATASPVIAIKPQSTRHSQLSPTNLAREQVPSVSAGKKRPREEASHDLDFGLLARAADKSGEGWIYTQGTPLFRPGAEDMTGGRGHYGNRRQEKTLGGGQRPELRSNKSQRMDPSFKQASWSNASNDATPSRPGHQVAAVDSSKEMVIDDFTLHLGIGWRRLSDDQHMQAAARGWARFIENHFALSEVRMRLESKGLQSYLVEASGGFFLFAENLRHGRLVSRTVDGALRNLQSSPPTFDGVDILTMDARRVAPAADTEMKID